MTMLKPPPPPEISPPSSERPMSPVGLQAEREAPLVLVIEDDEDMREMYIGGLTAMGFRATGQRDGVSGVQAALALRPAAVLIDVGLPVLNGIEATRLIKEDPRTRACLVVVMTGHGMKKFEEARAAGCDAFFCKPFATTALAEALRTLSSPVSRSRPRHPPVRGYSRTSGSTCPRAWTPP